MPAPGDTLYSFRNGSKVVLQRERANTTQLAAERAGALVAPSDGTYTLLAENGDSVVTGSITVTGSIATYNIAALDLPSTLGLGPRYLERWDLDMPDGQTYTVRRLACVARFALFPPLVQSDLVEGEYPDLLVSMGPDAVNDLQAIMDATWASCIRHLERRGSWEDIVVDSADLWEWYRHEVLRRVFKSMLQQQDSERWRELFIEHRDEARMARDNVAITVDRDRDGQPDHLGKEPVAKTVHANAAPRRRWWHDPRFG